jgi:hypothetical protein
MKLCTFVSIGSLLCASIGVWAQTDSVAKVLPKTSAVAQKPDSLASNETNVCKVESIVFATGIQDRAPVGGAKEFGPTQHKIFCWTKLSIQHAPFIVNHIWYNDDDKVLEVPLRLRYASGRLWSYKTVTPGNWHVDIVDKAGKVLGSDAFVVK